MRSVGDAVTDLKAMFEKIKKVDKKHQSYLEPCKEDIAKLLPKMKTNFQNVEKCLTNADEVDDANMLATCRKVSKDFEAYNNCAEWFKRLMPKDNK